MSPLVSVIIPNYNGERTLGATLESVLSQEVELEVLVVDDRSTDGSVALLRKIAAVDGRLRFWEMRENSGPGACRNIGLSNARGDFVALVDSDDLWLPGKLGAQVEFMLAQGLDFSFTDYYEVMRNGDDVGKAWLQCCPLIAELPSYFYLRGFGMCLTTVLRRDAIGSVRFPEDRGIATEDYAFFLSLLKKGVTGRGMRLASAAYFASAQSRSSNKWRQVLSVLRCNIRYGRLNPAAAVWYWMIYVVHRFIDKLRPTRSPVPRDHIHAVIDGAQVS